jgi:hypothetical protein
LERSGSDSDENDATGNEQSGFRDDDQTRFDQSGGVGSHNTRNCPTCQTFAIQQNTSQNSVASMLFDSNKFVHFNSNANEGVPGLGQGGTCFSVGHEGDYALILSGEYHRLRSLSPPRASQVAIIHGKEHVWIFGRVNGRLVAFEAVLEDHLGGDTELVLGVSALRQVNAARQKVAGQDEETIDLTSEWYKRIGEHSWRLKAICSSGGLVAPVVKVGTQQTTMISTRTYHELRSANQAGALRLADQAALASSRGDLLANG